jgi:hypothetical protein
MDKEIKMYSSNIGNNQIYNYIEIHGFEIRVGRTNSSTYNAIKPEDHMFEIRVRHVSPELIEVLREKIMDWLK